MRGRVVGVVVLLLLAPVSAELLQAYLGDLGGPFVLVFLVFFFAPLYGGAALLIREVAVRTGRGWPGRMLLAAAFGVAMPTFIDGSFFTPVMSDVDDWSDILHGASFLGIGWAAVLTWVGGHVLMSISAPTIVAEAFSRRPGPWLGRIGLAVVSVGFIALAVFVHQDQSSTYDVHWDARGLAISVAIVVLLVALAFTPLGRPLAPAAHRTPPAWICLLVGAVGMAGFDLVPMSWLGVTQDVGVLVVGLGLLAWWSRSPHWTVRHLAAVAFGALLARTITGFLSPLPHDTTWAEKIAQNVSYLILILVLGALLWRRTSSAGVVDGAAQPDLDFR